jgi:hypothetical protein
MLLSELTGYHSAKEQRLRDVLKTLKDEGKYTVRNGSFAVVLIPPGKNYVFRCWTIDEGYTKWLKYIEANPSKHFPKVISKIHELPVFFKQPEAQSKDKIYVARVEKLEQLKPRSTASEAIDTIHAYIDSFAAPETLVLGDIIEHLDNEGLEAELEFVQDNKSFFETYMKVTKWSAKNARRHDLRSTNIMVRDNGDLVITDPAADWSEANLPRPLADQLFSL